MYREGIRKGTLSPFIAILNETTILLPSCASELTTKQLSALEIPTVWI